MGQGKEQKLPRGQKQILPLVLAGDRLQVSGRLGSESVVGWKAEGSAGI